MARPVRYCSRCGEFVAEQYVTRPVPGRGLTTRLQLVHITGSGVRIHRAHAPTEESTT